jgi:hypothetical protein
LWQLELPHYWLSVLVSTPLLKILFSIAYLIHSKYIASMSTDDLRAVKTNKKSRKRPRVSEGLSGPEPNIRRVAVDHPPLASIRIRSNNVHDSDAAGVTQEATAAAPALTEEHRPLTPPSKNLENLSIAERSGTSKPATTIQDTPVRTNSSSRIHTPPTQLQNSNSEQKAEATLSLEAARASKERTNTLVSQPITRLEMEKTLLHEINGAVRMLEDFCETELRIPESSKRQAIQEQLQNIVECFLLIFQKWSTDRESVKSQKSESSPSNTGEDSAKMKETDMYKPIVELLNSVAKVAFVPNHFRPRRHDVVDHSKYAVGTDDQDDTDAMPDLVQGVLDGKDKIHWNDVEFIVECKLQPGQLHAAIMQLSRYARATFIHQIHRNHVYSLAICGVQATFVRFNRSEIIHSSTIDLSNRDGLRKFVNAMAGLSSLGAEDFGYDSHFSFYPEPKGTSEDRLKHRQWRYTQDGNQWRIVEIICQRKCLIGRATTVLRLSKIGSSHTRRVLKMIWKPETRPHEGESLRAFKGCRGVCQCEWMDTGVSTALPEPEKLKTSAVQKFFFPNVELSKFKEAVSLASENQSKSNPASMKRIQTELRHEQSRPHPAEARVKCAIMMGEGISLWRVPRLLHLLIVLRDALVGRTIFCGSSCTKF